MKSLLIALLALGIAGCSNTSNNTNSQVEDKKTTAYVDTLLYVSNLIVDSVPFIKLQMNPENAYVSMADSAMPSESDSTIALCVEAAFTGELLKNFTTINIGIFSEYP